MKIEIINKPMLCWDNDESEAKEYHVLAKVTECDSKYPFKVLITKNTYKDPWDEEGMITGFKNAKAIPEVTELTVAEISKLLGKTVKIIE
jgi:hypothetical protein